MKTLAASLALLTIAVAAGCQSVKSPPGPRRTIVNRANVEAEIAQHYSRALPEIQEYVRWTALQFGPTDLWLPADAWDGLSPNAREQKVQYLVALLAESDYGRHLCRGLAEASALQDARLVPGLLKVAGYHRDDGDYDCRPKWMAVAALARQESDAAVPLLVSLVDHGNTNTRKWARAALARITGQDFKEDKRAWAAWWQEQGHPPIAEEFLQPGKPAGT